MSHHYGKLLLSLLFTVMMLANANVQAADKSLADTKIVLQISDNDPSKQTLVLNVANNLIKHYGPESVDIEIVAFGPGLRLLFADNSNNKRIAGLVSNNVKFSACSNTHKKMTQLLGKPPKLNSNATMVSAGVVRIIDLENQGYKLIKP